LELKAEENAVLPIPTLDPVKVWNAQQSADYIRDFISGGLGLPAVSRAAAEEAIAKA
jgi:hypothetical protein